jgi:hypothetical protein
MATKCNTRAIGAQTVRRIISRLGLIAQKVANGNQKHYIQIARTIAKWYDCQGPNATAERLKAIKQYWLEIARGDASPKPPQWVKLVTLKEEYDRFGRPLIVPALFKHEFKVAGRISRGLFNSEDKFRVQAVLSVLNAASAIKGMPTQQGSDTKFLERTLYHKPLPFTVEAITHPMEYRAGLSEHNFLWEIQSYAADLARKIPYEPTRYLPDLRLGKSQNDSKAGIASDVLRWSACFSVEDVYAAPNFRDWVEKIGLLQFMNEEKVPHPLVGDIHKLPSPKGKVRYVASPNPLVQGLLRDAHVQLVRVAEQLPDSYHLDQDLGRERVSQLFGRPCSFFDLSDATDLFHRELGKAIMEGLGIPAVVQRYLFDSSYKFKDERGETYQVHWNAGWAMGTFCSFPLLTVAHCALLEVLAPGLPKFVVGDDLGLFHFNPKTKHVEVNPALRYRALLTSNGMTINEKKSITNAPNFGEFAGRLFLKGVDITPINLSSLATFWHVDTVRRFPWIIPGNGSRSRTSRRVRKIARILGAIPTDAGGFGRVDLFRNTLHWEDKVIALATTFKRYGLVPETGTILGRPELVHMKPRFLTEDLYRRFFRRKREIDPQSVETLRAVWNNICNDYYDRFRSYFTRFDLHRAALHVNSEPSSKLGIGIKSVPMPAPGFDVSGREKSESLMSVASAEEIVAHIFGSRSKDPKTFKGQRPTSDEVTKSSVPPKNHSKVPQQPVAEKMQHEKSKPVTHESRKAENKDGMDLKWKLIQEGYPAHVAERMRLEAISRHSQDVEPEKVSPPKVQRPPKKRKDQDLER